MSYAPMDDDGCCIICFDALDGGDHMTSSSCKCVGQYHIACLEKWRTRSNTCPTCSRALSPLMLDEEAGIPVAVAVSAVDPRGPPGTRQPGARQPAAHHTSPSQEEEQQGTTHVGIVMFLVVFVVFIVLMVIASE